MQNKLNGTTSRPGKTFAATKGDSLFTVLVGASLPSLRKRARREWGILDGIVFWHEIQTSEQHMQNGFSIQDRPSIWVPLNA